MVNKFKIGDVVQLRSGGPLMTIEAIEMYGSEGTEEKATCIWFEGSKTHSQLFATVLLVSAD